MLQPEESFAIYLKYKTLEDMLKVILFSSQSALGLTPMLYHINYNNQQILFIQTGAVGSGIIVHYIIQGERPNIADAVIGCVYRCQLFILLLLTIACVLPSYIYYRLHQSHSLLLSFLLLHCKYLVASKLL